MLNSTDLEWPEISEVYTGRANNNIYMAGQ